MKHLYWLKINGKRKSSLITFTKHAYNKKERNVMVKYYTKLGYDVHVSNFKYVGRDTYKKKTQDYIDSDAYYYNGEMNERIHNKKEN